jgi:endonuclease/exonuclease/phosphatase family metal-dependent hydrolase
MFSIRILAVALCTTVLSSTAAAQSTIVLNQPGTQVTDTTVRSGAYTNINYDTGPLLTRRSVDADWERRTILQFDTESTIPSGAQITSATLTLTVKSSLGSTIRPLQAFRVTESFQEEVATWLRRDATANWLTPGVTLAEQSGAGSAGSLVGSKVVIDLTTAVQRAVNGEFVSRSTRLLLLDSGGDAKESYREYYPSEDGNAANRPTLSIVIANGAAVPLKVLQWNIAQGYGEDGLSNINRIVAFIVLNRPDVVSFNEIMMRSSSNHPQRIADGIRAQTGETWSYHWVQKTGGATGEGEAVMTRLAMEAVDDYLLTVSRSVAMVRVNVNGRNLSLFSTHLDHQSSGTRLSQVRQLVTWSATHAEQRIIAGDFNGWPGTNEINEMLKTHIDGWATAKTAGTAFSYPGNPDGNTRNTRIDFVFASKGATFLSVDSARVYDTRDASGKRPSDHNPLIVTFLVR